jgi:hypothetical protein
MKSGLMTHTTALPKNYTYPIHHPGFFYQNYFQFRGFGSLDFLLPNLSNFFEFTLRKKIPELKN